MLYDAERADADGDGDGAASVDVVAPLFADILAGRAALVPPDFLRDRKRSGADQHERSCHPNSAPRL